MIRRVVARHFKNWGILVDRNQLGATVPNRPIVEDITAAFVTPPISRGSNGTAEACVWIGNTATVRRIDVHDCAWEGLRAVPQPRTRSYEDVNSHDNEIGVYFEHYNNDSTIRRLKAGPNVRIGVYVKWADPALGSIPGCTNMIIEQSYFDTELAGVVLDEGTKQTTVRSSTFVNQCWAAIGNYLGVGTSGTRAATATAASSRALSRSRLSTTTREPAPNLSRVTDPDRAQLTVLHVCSRRRRSGVVCPDLVRDQVGRGRRVFVAGVLGRSWPMRRRSRVPSSSVGRNLFSRRQRRGRNGQLARIIRSADPDLVHLHSSKAGLAGRLALRGRLPTVFQPHSWSFEAVGGVVRRAAIVWNASERGGRTRSSASATASASGAWSRDPRSVHSYPERGRPCRLPAGNHAARLAARSRLALGEEPIVVCTGRLCHQKGQDRLVEAGRPSASSNGATSSRRCRETSRCYASGRPTAFGRPATGSHRRPACSRRRGRHAFPVGRHGAPAIRGDGNGQIRGGHGCRRSPRSATRRSGCRCAC